MAVFLSVTTNAFTEVMQQVTSSVAPAKIRRPLMGYEIKEDTYATMTVLDSTQRPIPLLDSSGPDGIGFNYANILLVSMAESRAEKSQIVETFGEDYIFFFGERPRIIQFNGIVLNTNDFNWKSEFWANYEKTFRGTRLLEKDARMYITIDDIVIEGYMMQAQQVGSADNPYHLPITFQFFVTNYAILSAVGSPFFTRYRDNATYSVITDNVNEYPNGVPSSGAASDEESSVATTPAEVESRARTELDQLGVSANDLESGHLLPGQGSFSNAPEYGSFGIQRAQPSTQSLAVQ